MKIIRMGIVPSERIWIGTCRSCNSCIEAEEKELTNIKAGDYRSEGPFCWMKCPVCNAGVNAYGYGGVLFYPKKGV